MKILEKLNKVIENISLPQIMAIAFIFRLLAVLFSKGYGFSDDHFETVELAWKLQNHIEAWQKGEVYLFNLIYIYLHLGIFQFADFIHLPNPEFKMFLVRLFHALASLPFVWLGFKIVARISSLQTAKIAALALALFWIFPFMSARSLREFICISPLFLAFYHLENTKLSTRNLLFAAIGFGLAFIFRLQTVFFPIGVGVYLLTQFKWKETLLLAFFTISFLLLTQGIFEYFYWGNPFASLVAYVDYNVNHSGDYPNGPWFQYIGTILGLCLPLFSLFLAAGYFSSFKKYPTLFWGSLLFIVFHSIFPNKQERFILPFLPFFIILGIAGIEQMANNPKIKIVKTGWFKIPLIIALVLNFIALPLLTFTFSKKSRCEAMSWFYDKKVDALLFANSGGIPFVPKFYADQNFKMYQLKGESEIEQVKKDIFSSNLKPTYVVITGQNQLDKTLENVRKLYPKINEVASFKPGIVDMIAYYLNPKHNVNETWTIYKIDN